jgi:hypothetical protein
LESTPQTQALGGIVAYQYDAGGRVTSKGGLSVEYYSYDNADRLVNVTEGGFLYPMDLTYDALGRLRHKNYSNGDPTVTFDYDSYPDATFCTAAGATAIGNMTHMTDAAGEEWSCFDARRRVTNQRRRIDGVNYDVATQYNASNQTTRVIYPDGDTVTYAIAPQGNLKDVSTIMPGDPWSYWIVKGATLSPTGRPASLPLGQVQQVSTTYTYDFRMRVKSIRTGASQQDQTFTYDNAGNVKTVVDNSDPWGTESITYGYDQLNRLISASGYRTQSPTASYTYDAIGNLRTKQEGPFNITLNYPASGPSSVRPHAVSSTTGTSTLTLGYDANGNLATQGSSTYGFDAENRLTVLGGPTSYTYDGHGNACSRDSASNRATGTSGCTTTRHGSTAR